MFAEPCIDVSGKAILLGSSVNKSPTGLTIPRTPARTVGRPNAASKHQHGDHRYPQQSHQSCQKWDEDVQERQQRNYEAYQGEPARQNPRSKSY